MNRALAAMPALAACSALVLASGCGSGKSSASTTPASAANESVVETSKTSKGSKSGLQADGKINYAKPAPGTPVRSGLVQIVYKEISIEPDTLKVKVGSTIKWTNQDPVEHNVTSASGPAKFASKNFGEGGTFEIKVDKPGVINYRCTLHPTTMNGTIEVVK